MRRGRTDIDKHVNRGAGTGPEEEKAAGNSAPQSIAIV